MQLRLQKRYGRIGGLKSVAGFTKRQRRLRARKAARARWAKVKGVAA